MNTMKDWDITVRVNDGYPMGGEYYGPDPLPQVGLAISDADIKPSDLGDEGEIVITYRRVVKEPKPLRIATHRPSRGGYFLNGPRTYHLTRSQLDWTGDTGRTAITLCGKEIYWLKEDDAGVEWDEITGKRCKRCIAISKEDQ